MTGLKAVIWDMDGVIADTAPYHLMAWKKVFKTRGVDFTGDDFRRNFGQRNDSIIRNTLGKQITRGEIEAIARSKETTYRRAARGKVKPLPGVIALMKSLSEHGFKMALASSAPMANIRLVTRELGIGDYLQVVVTGQDVAEGKPSPQGFLLAARKLGAAPADCAVIEDAIAGVTACRRAGMRCIAVTNTHPRQRLSEADLVIDTLEEVTADDIMKLIEERIKMEQSLVLVKPDAMERELAGVIIARLQSLGLKLAALKMLHMGASLAGRHYAVHAGKPFFNDLIEYITSTPIVAAVFRGENAVEAIRKALGATDPAKAGKGTIRGDFGLDIQRNAVHGSDSAETAEKEIKLFFSGDEVF